MPSRDQLIQKMARNYREENDIDEIDVGKFAEYLIKHGMKPPPAPTAQDLMAKAARHALKQEIRKDSATGRPYHAWHAVPQGKNSDGQLVFSYIDIDDAPREPMRKALGQRISQMVDDGVQVAYDAQHWNRINPSEEPIQVQEMLDLRDQVEWRIQGESPDQEDGAADSSPPNEDA